MARILVIDDEADMRLLLSQILQRDGHEAVEAADGAQGLSLTAKQRFDIVITDILMPGKEGVEVISTLRKCFPDTKVIAISGGGRVNATHYLETAHKFGADRSISKPFYKQQILDAITGLLDEREHAC